MSQWHFTIKNILSNSVSFLQCIVIYKDTHTSTPSVERAIANQHISDPTSQSFYTFLIAPVATRVQIKLLLIFGLVK